MAIEVNLVRNGFKKKGFVGFSWTTLFFGFFVPLFRGDWLWLLIMLILGLFTYGISNIVLAFLYNKIYTNKLLEEGWQPTDENSFKILNDNNMLDRVPDNCFSGMNFNNMRNNSMKRCINCGNVIENDAKFCPVCGKLLVKTCENCQTQVNLNSEYCSNCGKKINKN